MSFLTERAEFENELDAWYARYPTDMTTQMAAIRAESDRHAEWLSFHRKALAYTTIAERCPIKLFRHFPFYVEIDVGKPRTDLGSGGIGGWLRDEPVGQALQTQGAAWWQPCSETGLSYGWPVLDDNHLCLGFDNVFREGLNGQIRIAEQRLRATVTPKERAFLESVITGNRAVISIAGRFAGEAERMLADEQDPVVRARLQRIARTARRVPADPPTTFFEAVNTLLFMREVAQSLDGAGVSILGHLDRMLWPFYQRDLADGRLTRVEAKDLLSFLLAFSDVRFGMRQVADHVGTNTTVVIGGCDAGGALIFNEITRIIIEIYRELHLVDPKLNARISRQHSPAYFALLADLTASGCNSLAIFNDDVVIPANEKMGKALEDCRLYVGGGCQENVLENTELNSRATIYLNLAQVLLMGFFPEDWRWFNEREGISLAEYADCATFEECYQSFLSNLKTVVEAHIEQRNRTEREGWRYNPCPLHSSTMNDCVERALDMTEGGARYSFGSVSLTGIGTLIDSLYAIREAVFTRGSLSLAQLRALLATDFIGNEAQQRDLVRVPKFGQEDDGIRAFSAQVFADLARVTSGKVNTRGGRYEASLFAFRSFADFGLLTGATPDGRAAGQYLSPGMSPSLLAFGRHGSIGQLLNALEPLDLTDYPVVAVLDMKLPLAAGKMPADAIVAIMKRFLDVGGSVLQMNGADQAALLDARAHPERHPDLVVRISGYSAYFITLPEGIQQEVIERTEMCV